MLYLEVDLRYIGSVRSLPRRPPSTRLCQSTSSRRRLWPQPPIAFLRLGGAWNDTRRSEHGHQPTSCSPPGRTVTSSPCRVQLMVRKWIHEDHGMHYECHQGGSRRYLFQLLHRAGLEGGPPHVLPKTLLPRTRLSSLLPRRPRQPHHPGHSLALVIQTTTFANLTSTTRILFAEQSFFAEPTLVLKIVVSLPLQSFRLA